VFNASNHEKQPKQSQKKENSSRKHSAKPTEEKSNESKSTEKKEKIWCSFHKNSSHSDAECRAQKKKTSALAEIENKERPTSYNDPNLVILDSGAQLSICFNENLLTDIHQVDPILIGGINSSDESITCSEAGFFPNLSKILIYYHPDIKKNILKFSDVHQKYNVQWLRTEKEFVFKDDSKHEVVFREMFEVYCNIFEPITKEIMNTNFTKGQKDKAILAREIQLRLACDSPSGLINAIKTNSIKDLPITIQDVINAEKFLGPNIPAIKGKSTNKHKKTIAIQEIEKCEEKLQTLIIDIMYVSQEPYLITISKPLDLIIVDHLPSYGTKESKNKAVVKTSLFGIIALYRSESFHISEIICDSESAFVQLEQDLNAIGTRLVPSLASSHSTAIVDRKIRFIKDRARSVLASLEFELPKSWIKWLIYFVVSRINLTPHSGNSISARESFIGRKTEYKIDLKIGFGKFAQAMNPNVDNSLEPRTHDCISLLPTGNKNGACIFYSISSGRPVTREKWVEVPIPQSVIDMIKKKAKDEKSLSSTEMLFQYRGADPR
jgi:hypothetical protein